MKTIGKPVPVKDRPKCRSCGKRLRPHWRYDWAITALEATSRKLDGYGWLARGNFCGLNCAARFAERLVGRNVHQGV